MHEGFTRRHFFETSLAGAATVGLGQYLDCAEAFADEKTSRQATGVKVGEITPTSAIVWMRVTKNPSHNAEGKIYPRRSRPIKLPEGMSINDLRGACPGAEGMVRLRYSTKPNLEGAVSTDWVKVVAKNDYTHQFRLAELMPGAVYYYAAETKGEAGEHAPLRGQFETAPTADQPAAATFTVITGKAYKDLDHPDGYHIYPAMGKLKPKFFVPTGDNVYYDNDTVLAYSDETARHHWHRMHGLPRCVDFHLRVPGYWEKDDHDTYFNDCWPGMKLKRILPLTFDRGLELFREQVPMGELTYRTTRWGRDLQVWFVEGRDYRSPNTMKDGPNKTIWGRKQKEWLLRTLKESTATFKVLVSPTPIVGPDRPRGKRDNHSNEAFKHEGDEIRAFFQKHLPERFVICCGDRHWQYHSIHPETKVHEFSCGPASDIHAGGSPGIDKEYHKFHRVKGGFLSVSVSHKGGKAVLSMRLHDVHGKVVYEYQIDG